MTRSKEYRGFIFFETLTLIRAMFDLAAIGWCDGAGLSLIGDPKN